MDSQNEVKHSDEAMNYVHELCTYIAAILTA